jgi:hypothetical protein
MRGSGVRVTSAAPFFSFFQFLAKRPSWAACAANTAETSRFHTFSGPPSQFCDKNTPQPFKKSNADEDYPPLPLRLLSRSVILRADVAPIGRSLPLSIHGENKNA